MASQPDRTAAAKAIGQTSERNAATAIPASLHYALSVITARALPDVRDGLKPVQRRILFTMEHDLHLRSDAERVYAHALGYFSEDEIAEAFAAARGVASPTQLRNNLKQDGRDLLAEFRRMAPEREQISIQRWSVRRVLLTIGVLAAAWLALGLVVSNWNAFA